MSWLIIHIQLFITFNIILVNLFQAPLPKLPVPPLQETLKKYEKTLQPLLNEQEQERVHSVIEKFANGLGPKLQLWLLNRREKMDNWVGEFYYSTFFLKQPSINRKSKISSEHSYYAHIDTYT